MQRKRVVKIFWSCFSPDDLECSECPFCDWNEYSICYELNCEDFEKCDFCPHESLSQYNRCGLKHDEKLLGGYDWITGGVHDGENYPRYRRSKDCINEGYAFNGRVMDIDCGDEYCEECMYLMKVSPLFMDGTEEYSNSSCYLFWDKEKETLQVKDGKAIRSKECKDNEMPECK